MDRTTPQQTFGQQIRRYRRRAGLTQEELAERAALSPRGLAYLERGERHPQPGTVRRLADALGLAEEERSAFVSLIDQDTVTGDTAAGVASSITIEVSSQSTLPLQPTPFIGREREVTAVMALLGREAVRLLTLTGPGGTGKTRLAVQVAAEVRDTFPDGAFFVSLAPLSDPGLVAPAIATALALKETGDRPVLETLKAQVGTKQLLLVLDNFEHLLPAAPQVGELLAACPHLVVLVTSRSCLHLAAEHEYLVPGMTLPGEQHRSHLAVLSRVDAVAFFLERARAIKPDFALTEENAPAMVEICHRLDGLPLALELAAARIRLFPPQALLARLERRLSLLTGGAKDRPSRQQTLRGAIDWSYSLLSKGEQTLFARLSVFASGCSFEAVEAVCNPSGQLDFLEGLTSLVDKSLLRQEGEEEPRFRMLETLREYARERLEERGEGEAIPDAHAAYFLALAEEAEPGLDGPDMAGWLARFDEELENVRAARSWLLDQGRAEQVVRLVAALYRFWYVRGYWSEGISWLEEGLASGDKMAPAVRAKGLLALGSLFSNQGGWDRAAPLYEEALSLCRELGDRKGCVRALNGLAILADHRHDYDQATVLYEEALMLSRELKDQQFALATLGNLGVTAVFQGNLARAKALYEEALPIWQASGITYGVILQLAQLGWVTELLGDLNAAETLQQEALDLARQLGDKRFTPSILIALGSIAVKRGQYGSAWEKLREAFPLGQELGAAEIMLDLLGVAAQLAIADGQTFRAAQLAGAEQAGCEALSIPIVPVQQVERDRVVAQARKALGEEAFNRAWERGRTMSLEEAITYALGERAQDR